MNICGVRSDNFAHEGLSDNGKLLFNISPSSPMNCRISMIFGANSMISDMKETN
jgi:hypothetical protein